MSSLAAFCFPWQRSCWVYSHHELSFRWRCAGCGNWIQEGWCLYDDTRISYSILGVFGMQCNAWNFNKNQEWYRFKAVWLVTSISPLQMTPSVTYSKMWLVIWRSSSPALPLPSKHQLVFVVKFWLSKVPPASYNSHKVHTLCITSWFQHHVSTSALVSKSSNS